MFTLDHAGAPSLVQMVDVQEMMYDPGSGSLFTEIVTYLLLEGGRMNLRMRQSQWHLKPAELHGLAGTEVRLTVCLCRTLSYSQLHQCSSGIVVFNHI